MKDLLNKYRFPLSLIFYEIVISLRIFAEMGLCSIHTFIHQLMWFNTVLLVFFIGYRKILKVQTDRLWILSAGSLLTFIPIVFSYIAGHNWALNYVEPQSFIQVLKDLFTLLCCHEYNWPMFPELLALLLGSLGISYFLSKNIKRSVLCSLFSFYGSFLLLGFSWIAVNPDHPTLFLLRSSFVDSKFYSLQMTSLFIILLSAANHKEVHRYFKDLRKVYFHAMNFFMIIIFYSLIIFVTEKPLTASDNIVTVIPTLFIVYTVRNVRKQTLGLKEMSLIWISVLSIIAMLTNSGL